MMISDPGSQLMGASRELAEWRRGWDMNQLTRFGAERGLELTFVEYLGDLVAADWRLQTGEVQTGWLQNWRLQIWWLQFFFKGLPKTLNDPMTKHFISKETK